MTTCSDCNNYNAYCKYLYGGKAVKPEQTECRYGDKFVPKADAPAKMERKTKRKERVR